MVVHYSVSLAWCLLHSLGRAALDNPYLPQKEVQYQMDWYPYLWNEMSGMAISGLAWATADGLVCDTALHPNQTAPTRQLQQEASEIG